MEEKQIYEKMQSELIAIANKYSIERLRISTYNFDRDFQRDSEGQFILVEEKAVIRALGKVTKVAIGEGCEFSTYEEAEKATKIRWSEYYKNVRANRSEADKIAERKRQKKYRDKKKAMDITFKRQK